MRGDVELIETEEILMARFQAGEEDAFVTLFDMYAKRLINFAHRFLFSQEESEDVAQQVLLAVYEKKERYDPSRPFRPWLFAIASRAVSNRLRDRKRHPRVSLDYSNDNADGNSLVNRPELIDQDRTENSCEKKEVVEVVRRALERLPENQRLAVTLAKFEEMPYQDIAGVMKVSLSAVESLLFRARQSLKTSLSPYINMKTPPPQNPR
jgi:RNA polymerase sigma-70 factor (ECF subfamily)